MPDEIREARQPMVTSLGIILGFLLNFLAQWAIRDDGKAPVETATDWVIVVTLFAAVALMLAVLFAMLSNAYRPEDSARRYRKLLSVYLLAISMAFSGMAGNGRRAICLSPQRALMRCVRANLVAVMDTR